MPMQKLLSKARQAIQDFDMIQDNDKIAVGLSGGKDSLTLLHILKSYQRFSPQKFELIAITLNPGGVDNSPLYKLCEELDVPFYEIQTDIKEIVFDIRKEKNPCSLCANLRRGALNNAAEANGCNVVALAHTKDDVVETMLMCLFREGRISTFSPVTELTRTGITVIRPLIFADETEIIAYMKACGYEAIKNSCPHDGFTERTEMRLLLENMAKQHPDIKNTIFGAIRRSKIDGWNPLV